MDIQRIEFERSGGFAGMRFTASIELDSLPAEDAAELAQLVEAADFFALPEEISSDAPGADRFQYVVTVETAEAAHTVNVSDATAPESLEPLLRKLTLLARGG